MPTAALDEFNIRMNSAVKRAAQAAEKIVYSAISNWDIVTGYEIVVRVFTKCASFVHRIEYDPTKLEDDTDVDLSPTR